jgi:hypothetical protein
MIDAPPPAAASASGPGRSRGRKSRPQPSAFKPYARTKSAPAAATTNGCPPSSGQPETTKCRTARSNATPANTAEPMATAVRVRRARASRMTAEPRRDPLGLAPVRPLPGERSVSGSCTRVPTRGRGCVAKADLRTRSGSSPSIPIRSALGVVPAFARIYEKQSLLARARFADSRHACEERHHETGATARLEDVRASNAAQALEGVPASPHVLDLDPFRSRVRLEPKAPSRLVTRDPV